jgi:cation transport ATPase
MKNRIFYFLLLIIVTSCTTLNHGNFNKRKYLNLKLKKVHTEVADEKNRDNPIDFKSKKIDIKSEHIVFTKNEADNNITVSNQPLNNDKSTSKENTIEKLNETFIYKIGNKLDIETTEALRVTEKYTKQNKNSKKKKSSLYYFSILLIVPFLIKSKKGVKISRWASKNKRKAQVLIGLLSLTGAASSFTLGNILQLDIDFSMVAVPIILGGLALGLNSLRLPTNKNLIKKRVSFGLLNISTFFGSFTIGSIADNSLFNAMSHDPEKIGMHPLLVGLLTLLVIGLLVISLIGLAALACTIACNGSAILAVVVLLGGGTLVITLAVLLLSFMWSKSRKNKPNSIKNKTKKSKESESDSTDDNTETNKEEDAKSTNNHSKNKKYALIFAILLTVIVGLFMIFFM